MRDITLGDTVYFDFTTRAFSTGVPATLSGTPALSVLEENNATPITSGVSVSVDRASVTGLNMATVVASGANGYEAGKGYTVYISAGTVDSTSVVGEAIAHFTIQANPVNWDKVAAPTSTVGLSGTTVGVATALGSAYDAAKTAADATTVAGEFSSLETHGDSAWATATGFATGTNISDLQTHGDSTWATATGFVTLTAQITESYRANGAAPTLAQFICEVLAHLGEAEISGTTKTINKFDHSTAAETFTLDSATDPATITRAS